MPSLHSGKRGTRERIKERRMRVEESKRKEEGRKRGNIRRPHLFPFVSCKISIDLSSVQVLRYSCRVAAGRGRITIQSQKQKREKKERRREGEKDRKKERRVRKKKRGREGKRGKRVLERYRSTQTLLV